MSDLVVAMALRSIAQPNFKDKLAGEHRRPKLGALLALVFGEPPGVIYALGDSAFDRALKIQPAKIMVARHPRDHAIVDAPAGARARRDRRAIGERTLHEGRIAGHPQHSREHIGVVRDFGAISDDREDVLGRAYRRESRGMARLQDCHARAIADSAPSDLTGRGYARYRFLADNSFKSGLCVRRVQPRSQRERARLRMSASIRARRFRLRAEDLPLPRGAGVTSFVRRNRRSRC